MVLEFDPTAPTRGGRGTEGRTENLDLGTIAASRLAFGFGVEVMGWAITESGGVAVAKVRLRDGRDVTGEVLAPIGLLAGGSSVVGFAPEGVTADTGLFVEVVSGSVEVVIYYRAPDR